jgi:flagellar biosynthetic protein FliQ
MGTRSGRLIPSPVLARVARMEQLSGHVVEALRLGLWLAAPALVASLIAGIVTGLGQAATQVQDAALSFVPRLFAVGLALALSGAWMSAKLVSFTSDLWRQIAALGS